MKKFKQHFPPAHERDGAEIGGNFHQRLQEEADVRRLVQPCRAQRQPVVAARAREPIVAEKNGRVAHEWCLENGAGRFLAVRLVVHLKVLLLALRRTSSFCAQRVVL